MAKASGPALFDLLDQEQVRAPRTSDSGPAVYDRGVEKLPSRASALQADRRSLAVEGEQPLVLRAGERRPGSGIGTTNRKVETGKTPPWVEVDDERVKLTLTSVRAAIVVFVLLIGLLAAFELGRSRGQHSGFAQGFHAGRDSFTSEALSEIEAARNLPPATEVINSLLVGSDSAGALSTRAAEGSGDQRRTASGPAQWIPGHTYIVAQGFQRGREADAQRAREFLASHGIETELIRFDSGAMQLITTRGFNRSDPAQRSLADQWLQKVHAAGVAYFASGGGYKLDGYFATFTGDRW
jgi:hypothetical protein